jgi:glycosyltransferase involved in cell wall biosynthesis
MFTANLAAIPYSDPWIISLHERVKVLNNEQNYNVSASYFFLDDLHFFDEIANLADVLVICRSRYCHRINQLITKFRTRGKRVLFDIDDFVFNTNYAHLIINTLDQDTDNPALWDYWFSYLSRMGETLRLCDSAITTNDYLANKIAEFSGLPVSVVPNFINNEQLVVSEDIFRNKEASGFARNDTISLGYFSGSPSHNLDYAIITSALEQVMDNDPRVELMVVGYIEAGATLSKFGNRIKYQPFQDYVNLQRLVSSVEFNLMPLQSNVFTNCKSELKYFESAIVGTLSIASPSYTYATAIQDGKNGYIAQAHQWTTVIQKAIENISSYPDMASTAFADANSKYAWSNQHKKIINALGL